MDPLTTAGTFSALVGLIGQYKSSRDAESGKDFNAFLTWLIKSGQEDLKSLIEANHGTSISIKALLNIHRVDFAERLERIESALAGYASSVEGFAPLAANTRPDSALSDQALALLGFYETHESGALLEVAGFEELSFHCLDGKGSWEPDEPRFIEDDLRILVDLQLLKLGHGSKGSRIFHYTRRAADLLKQSAPNS